VNNQSFLNKPQTPSNPFNKTSVTRPGTATKQMFAQPTPGPNANFRGETTNLSKSPGNVFSAGQSAVFQQPQVTSSNQFTEIYEYMAADPYGMRNDPPPQQLQNN